MSEVPLKSEAQSDKVETLRRKMMVIDLLTLLKRKYKHRELSEMTGLPPSVLSRYARRRMLPSDERIEEILSALKKTIRFEDLVKERIKPSKGGYYDVTPLIWDTAFLRLVAVKVSENFSKYGASKVLTAAADGVPIACLVGEELGADLVVAKERKEVGLEDFIEDSYSPTDVAIVRTFYVPRKAIRRNDRLLIVDDVVRTGGTIAALVRLAERAGGKVIGLFAMVSVGNKWRAIIEEQSIPYYSLLRLP